MTGADPLPPAVLKRKAVVYVRQSTLAQVETNLESRRRQYELVDIARRRGFREVEVIDDDLGRSADGAVARPGFERLVAWLCAGEVGAVLCLDASRLARNGRDWHHLLELCGLVEARVIDLDGVYDPCRPNDRLLLGMKGSISEFELGVLRARMTDAARAKARRGELRIGVPVGYVWHREVGLGFDPDLRLQEAIRLIFARFRELGSARQVLLSLTADGLHFPRPSDGKRMTTFDWTPVRYRNVIAVLKNPFYAGAYVYGKSEKRTTVVDGRPRKSYGHGRPLEAWEVLLKEHHEGYIGWAEFERNQTQLAANTYGRIGGVKSGRGGRALLAGILACGRCGRRLAVTYTGLPPGTSRLPLRPPQPDAGVAALPGVRRSPGRRRHRRGDPPRRGADGDRGRPGSGASTGGEPGRTRADRRAGSAAGPLRGLARRTSLRRLRSRPPPHRRAAGEGLGDGAPARRGGRGPARRRAGPGARRRRAGLRGAGRRSRCRMERAWRHDARPAAAAARADHRHHRRRGRGGARGHPDDPLAGRPALAAAGPQAEVRRARLPHPRRGPGGDAEHGHAMVGRGHRRVAEPDGHAHRSGKDVDRAPRQLAAQGARDSRLPLRREEQ